MVPVAYLKQRACARVYTHTHWHIHSHTYIFMKRVWKDVLEAVVSCFDRDLEL